MSLTQRLRVFWQRLVERAETTTAPQIESCDLEGIGRALARPKIAGERATTAGSSSRMFVSEPYGHVVRITEARTTRRSSVRSA
ncbi:MAG: hypothetical protein ACHREM_14740 [Polyangiales bacterium]